LRLSWPFDLSLFVSNIFASLLVLDKVYFVIIMDGCVQTLSEARVLFLFQKNQTLTYILLRLEVIFKTISYLVRLLNQKKASK
jgi:hypothetical protein